MSVISRRGFVGAMAAVSAAAAGGKAFGFAGTSPVQGCGDHRRNNSGLRSCVFSSIEGFWDALGGAAGDVGEEPDGAG